ncbi:MAG: MBOAT family protein [Paludibacteraceae bacterium]|nr:MBOAT family protein [Paludibacteraceae bacterium]
MLEYLKTIFAFDESSPLLFTQFYFWAFFAIVYAVFSLIHSKRLLRNAFLFFVSLFFYYKTSGLFLFILLFVTCSDFLIAKRIDACQRVGWRRFWLTASVVIDLGLLCYFKYAYFFTHMVNDLLGTQFEVYDVFAWAGNQLVGQPVFNVDQIVLPVGISFFIFQVISYTADVYMRKVKPVRNILDFGFYVSFFPQLVAGPIVRASDFIPQLYRPFNLSRRQFGLAVFWILNGLLKKILLSDFVAVNFVDRVFDSPLLFGGFENFAALIGYSLQVYADFSGYTDIAIGVAMLMGFYLPKNFNSPYKAPNASNFWKRWHISLSRWLQNYLYIPLGGNRNASFGTFFWIFVFALVTFVLTGSIWVGGALLSVALIVGLVAWLMPKRRKSIIANLNAFITMLLGGMWHGASWNFIIWGGLNGLGMIVYKFWRDWNWHIRIAVLTLLVAALCVMRSLYPGPVWNLFTVWGGIILAVSLVRYLYWLFHGRHAFSWIANAWAILQTFVFISFTRLFFRSGSNLDPETANQVAWDTAKNMVHQIGSPWNLEQIPDICQTYWNVFLMIVLGMIIHWLPDRFKRQYRMTFAMMPIPLIMLCVVLVVFVVYQFVTADLQPFIYFQF